MIGRKNWKACLKRCVCVNGVAFQIKLCLPGGGGAVYGMCQWGFLDDDVGWIRGLEDGWVEEERGVS